MPIYVLFLVAIVYELYHICFFDIAKVINQLVQHLSDRIAICEAQQLESPVGFFGYFEGDSFFGHPLRIFTLLL